MINQERKTQRHPCAGCKGTGSITSPGDKCGACQGQGYLNLESGQEVVCPTCRGDGFTLKTRPCKECNGKGFRVGIYEFIKDSDPCSLCGGKGMIDEKNWVTDLYGEHMVVRQVKCPRCHGNGSTESFSYHTIK